MAGSAKRDLAGESSRQVENLLVRQDKRRRKARKLSSADGRYPGLSQPKAVCGALAMDAEDNGTPKPGKKADEDAWEDVSDVDGDGNDVETNTCKDRHAGVEVMLCKEDVGPMDTSKKKKRGPTFTKQDRVACLEIHRTHLLFLLARGLALSVAADDPVMQAVAMSLVPATTNLRDAGALERLVRNGFGDAVRPVEGDPEGVDGNVLERLARGNDVNVEQLIVISAALLRGAGLPTRIMWALGPAPLRPEDVVGQLRDKAVKREKKILSARKSQQKRDIVEKKEEVVDGPTQNELGDKPQRKCDVELELATAMAIEASSWAAERKKSRENEFLEKDGPALLNTPSLSKGSDLDPRYWLEVYSHEKGSWETLHVIPPPTPLIEPYITAFNGRGAKDLTKKYCGQGHLARIAPKRDEAWWNQTIASHRRAETLALRECLETSKHRLGGKSTVTELVAKASDHEDRGIIAKEQKARREVPTTIKGFQKHDLFVLKRHIKTHEVLKPGSQAVGMLKGEAYYNKSDLCVVHTAEKWKRQGRIVRESEMDKPAKMIKKRGVQHANADLELLDLSSTQHPMSNFYGPWQTDEWQIPSAKDGIVPKNEWGSVEIPPLAHALPGGTVHVDLPDAAKVCRQLGINFADAVSGFEYKKRRMIPKKCGVVVCTESEELLRSAWSDYMQHAQQVAKEKRLAEGEAGWRDLLAALITHIRVHQSFADDIEGALLEHASMKNDILVGGVGPGKGIKQAKGKRAEEEEEERGIDLDVEEI